MALSTTFTQCNYQIR